MLPKMLDNYRLDGAKTANFSVFDEVFTQISERTMDVHASAAFQETKRLELEDSFGNEVWEFSRRRTV